MKKKNYEKPSVEVVELKQREALLNPSDQASRQDYGLAIEEDWE